jgi:hypothetical protein
MRRAIPLFPLQALGGLLWGDLYLLTYTLRDPARCTKLKRNFLALYTARDTVRQGSSTRGPQSPLPWPSGRFKKNNYKR